MNNEELKELQQAKDKLQNDYQNTVDKINELQQENKQLKENKRKAIEYIKSKHAIIDTDYIRIFDLFVNRVEQGYINELLEILEDKENINNNAEDIEDLDARIIRAEEQYDKQKEEMILGEKENE